MLLGEKYKFRGLMDSGATSTLISTGLLNLMAGFDLHPSSFSFFGVGPDAMKFAGIIYDMSLRFADNLVVLENVGVYEHPNPTLILGNSTVGGINAKVGIVAHCAFQSLYVLQDKHFNVGVVPYVKNVEGSDFPAKPVTNVAKVA